MIIECAHAQKEIQDSFTTKDADHVAQGIAHHPQNGALVEETETPSRFSTLSDVDWTPHIHKARDTAKNVGAALGDGARALLERVLPEPEPTPPHQQGRHNRRAISENTTRMIGIAIAIPLIVVFIVAVLYMRQSDTAGQQDIFKQARRAYQTAQSAANSAADPETTRALWQTAFLELNQAKSSDPDNKEIAEMYGKAQAALDALDNVQRPPLSLLWNYGAGGDHSIAASRITVYVLDSEANQVLRHDLNESRDGTLGRDPSRIAYKEQAVGEKPIGEPAYLVWLGAGGARTQDALFILTTDDELLEYDQSWGLKRLTFDTGLMPISVRVLDAFDGKLYILDPVYSQIWRFPAAGDVFGPPEGYFAASAPDLGQAVDMTIDGAIYVLLQDQRILKFWGGQAQPFEIIGLPRPLVRPVALAVEGDQQNGALYVADAGSQCIIVLDKNGHFISQLCAEQNLLENLESLAIDQDNRVLYMIANGRLYSLSLPTLPLPEEPESP